MKVTDHLKKAKKTLFSFEILPPIKGSSVYPIYEGIERLLEFKPPFINVTYHREEYLFKPREDGAMEKVPIRRRPGTIGLCAAIKHKYQVDTVPHIICGGFSRNETEDALTELNFLDIQNVLLLRGDAAKGDDCFRPHANGNPHALNLVHQVARMNQGIYEGSDLTDPVPTDFCIGVGGYPEKHSEAPDMKTDIDYLKQKVDAGADYIVTQMFFDNQKFFDFVKTCRDAGITVPIIPGIKPLTTANQIKSLSQFFHVGFPEALVKAVEACTSPEAVLQVGIEWGIQQSKELIQFGVPCLHYYTMSKADAAYAIAREVF